MRKRYFLANLQTFLAAALALFAVSCADNDLQDDSDNGDKSTMVRFDINEDNEVASARQNPFSRTASVQEANEQRFIGQKLLPNNNANLNLCLIETTVDGVNPVKHDATTRANVINRMSLGDFSSTGVRGTSAANITESWFNNARTKNNGELYSPLFWSWNKPFGRFFAVYPVMNINAPDATSSASVEFTLNTDVRKQVDLMTACSGDVHYATRLQAPVTSLNFRHALTAIRFAVGQNLSFDKTIRQITLKNVLLKSKFVLSKSYDGSGAQWVSTGYNTRGDVTLDGLNYKTNENSNSIVRDVTMYPSGAALANLKDNYTFYMIPQELTNKVTAVITFTDNTDISVPLKGSWEAGTTRTYKLSQKTSTWNYTLEATSPAAVGYKTVQSDKYSITSYRTAPDGTKKPVAWKVVGYSVDEGVTWTENKPAWLTAISKTSGSGGTEAEQGTATLVPEIVDLTAKRNKQLQESTPLGTAATPYNLSNNKGEITVQNTANCYVISAPGFYCIPLVYGNAIKNGETNASAFKSSAPVTKVTFGSPAAEKDVILHTFVDHNGAPITDPWIEKTNNKANNGIDKAEVVWADEANLVTLPSASIYRDGNGNAFVKFEVKKEDIKSGNAVLAVKKGNTTLWSWHLWFAPAEVLNKIPVTNKQGKVYNFANEPLGWKPNAWRGTPYSSPRSVKIKVEQEIANAGVKQQAVVTITQNAGIEKNSGAATMYQWGRKDPFPGSSLPPKQGSIKANAGDQIYMQNVIQNPGSFYITGTNGAGIINTNAGLTKYYYFYNLWSINNRTASEQNHINNTPVVKTIYDPSPVGFSVPSNAAFTGFTANGLNEGTMNVDGTDNQTSYNAQYGHVFWTNSTKTSTIAFPAAGYRDSKYGAWFYGGTIGDYWSADPNDVNNGCVMGLQVDKVYPLYRNIRTYGFAVRPVAE